MPTNVTYNGTVYQVPQPGDTYAWENDLSSYLVALATGGLTKAGGLVSLTAEADFGATAGLKALYYKSRGTNPAASGAVRLAKTDVIGIRNAANSLDNTISQGDAIGGVADELYFTRAGVASTLLTGQPYARAHISSPQSTVTPGTPVTIVWNVEDVDTDNAYSPATGVFTVPTGKDGQYLITYSIALQQTAAIGQIEVLIVAGGGSQTDSSPMNSVPINGIIAVSGSVVMNLTAGQTISVQFKSSANTATTQTSVANSFTVKRLV